MIKFRDIAAAAVITGAGIAASFAIVSVPAHAAVTARPLPSCAAQLTVIGRAEAGHAGARQLTAAGLPELAAAERGATSLAGARWYGIALADTAAAIRDGNGTGDCWS